MKAKKRVRKGALLQVYLPEKLVAAIWQRKAETGLSIKFAAEKLFTWWITGGDLAALPSAPEREPSAALARVRLDTERETK